MDFSIELVEKKMEVSSVDSSLGELVVEAGALFKVLDAKSAIITNLEKQLGELKAHFPFRFTIEEERPSDFKVVTEEHRYIADAEYFVTKMFSYLAWESTDENAKHFRLFLVTEEKEFVHCNYGADDYHRVALHKSRLVFKKPLAETDLKTRLSCIQHLSLFIDSFSSYLKRCRLSIEGSFEPVFEPYMAAFED